MMASPPLPPQSHDRTTRVVALTDGVFAIAMTLLALELRVPELESGVHSAALINSLRAEWPRFSSFVISFLVLAAYWMGHRVVFDYIQHVDRWRLWLNTGYLVGVAFVPFATALCGRFMVPAAVLIYAGSLAVVGLLLATIWVYATANRRLVQPSLPEQTVKSELRRILIAPVVALFAGAVAPVSTVLSMFLFHAIPVLYVMPLSRRGRWSSVGSDESAS